MISKPIQPRGINIVRFSYLACSICPAMTLHSLHRHCSLSCWCGICLAFLLLLALLVRSVEPILWLILLLDSIILSIARPNHHTVLWPIFTKADIIIFNTCHITVRVVCGTLLCRVDSIYVDQMGCRWLTRETMTTGSSLSEKAKVGENCRGFGLPNNPGSISLKFHPTANEHQWTIPTQTTTWILVSQFIYS